MIERLQQKILSKLPGWQAHQKMAPPLRKPLAPMPQAVKYSAVCIVIYIKIKEPHTLLIKRTEDGKTHGGQISFPGGRLDATDFSLTYCALRECEEEIGLNRNELTVLGALSELYIPPSNFLVKPIVCCAEVKKLNPSADEVAELIEVPLRDLFHSKNKKNQQVWASGGTGTTWEVPTYQYGNYTIWGATAMILAELEDVCLSSI